MQKMSTEQLLVLAGRHVVENAVATHHRPGPSTSHTDRPGTALPAGEVALAEILCIDDSIEVALPAVVSDQVLARRVNLRHPCDGAVLQADDEAVTH